MRNPEPGDVLLRGSAEHGYFLVDPCTHELVAGPVGSVVAALALAALHTATVWQQSVDNRGRALGDLAPFPSDELTHPAR